MSSPASGFDQFEHMMAHLFEDELELNNDA